jgi:hypothetical protein
MPSGQSNRNAEGTMSERNERKTGRGDASKLVGARRNATEKGDGTHENGPKHKRTAGKDRDADRSGESRNEGHGHPREERGE